MRISLFKPLPATTTHPQVTVMLRSSIFAAACALFCTAHAQCGSGTPEGIVDGDGTTFTSVVYGEEVYAGPEYLVAIQTALGNITSGERVSVLASGSIGAASIFVDSGKIFEGCGAIDALSLSQTGAIESTDTVGAQIPYLTLTGSPFFGMRLYGTTDLVLGTIVMNLSDGIGIRFERDEAPSTNVYMDSIRVTGAGSHAVETWNIDGLTINEVIARDVGESGLLLQETKNAHVGLVDGENVATGSGYATFHMANANGQLDDGTYATNIFVDSVVARGGGRGIFCVSDSGGAEIANIDLMDAGSHSILIENCHNVAILGGTVNGGGDFRVSARAEFPNTSDVSITVEANGVSVVESPCGENINWAITGDATLQVCS